MANSSLVEQLANTTLQLVEGLGEEPPLNSTKYDFVREIPGHGWGAGASSIGRAVEEALMGRQADLDLAKNVLGVSAQREAHFGTYAQQHYAPMVNMMVFIISFSCAFLLCGLLYCSLFSEKRKVHRICCWSFQTKAAPPVSLTKIRCCTVLGVLLACGLLVASVLALWTNSEVHHFFPFASGVTDASQVAVEEYKAKAKADIQGLMDIVNRTIQDAMAYTRNVTVGALAAKVDGDFEKDVQMVREAVGAVKNMSTGTQAIGNASRAIIDEIKGVFRKARQDAASGIAQTTNLITICDRIEQRGGTGLTLKAACYGMDSVVGGVQKLLPKNISEVVKEDPPIPMPDLRNFTAIKEMGDQLMTKLNASDLQQSYEGMKGKVEGGLQAAAGQVSSKIEEAKGKLNQTIDKLFGRLEQGYSKAKGVWDKVARGLRAAKQGLGYVAEDGEEAWSVQLMNDALNNEQTRYILGIVMGTMLLLLGVASIVLCVLVWHVHEQALAPLPHKRMLPSRPYLRRLALGVRTVALGFFLVAAGAAVFWVLGYVAAQLGQQICEPLQSKRIYTEIIDNPEVMGGYVLGRWLHGDPQKPLTVGSVLNRCSNGVPVWVALELGASVNFSAVTELRAKYGPGIINGVNTVVDNIPLPLPGNGTVKVLGEVGQALAGVNVSNVVVAGNVALKVLDSVADTAIDLAVKGVEKVRDTFLEACLRHQDACPPQDQAEFNATVNTALASVAIAQKGMDFTGGAVAAAVQRLEGSVDLLRDQGVVATEHWQRVVQRLPPMVVQARALAKDMARDTVDGLFSLVENVTLYVDDRLRNGAIGQCALVPAVLQASQDTLCEFLWPRIEALWVAWAIALLLLAPLTFILMLLSAWLVDAVYDLHTMATRQDMLPDTNSMPMATNVEMGGPGPESMAKGKKEEKEGHDGVGLDMADDRVVSPGNVQSMEV